MFYHVWFVTKNRRPVLVGEVEKRSKNVFGECINRHKYKVLEMETNKDYVHMLVECKDKTELSSIVRTIKCVSAKELRITPRSRVGNIRLGGYYTRKCVEEQSSFWARRYGYNEVLENEIENIRDYIRNQKQIPHTSA